MTDDPTFRMRHLVEEAARDFAARPAILDVPAGVKGDAGKDPWDLLPWGPVRDVVRVLEHGARKYRPNNWMTVPNARARYFAAAMRHIFSWWRGERLDPESGLSHLSHASCNLLFLAHFDEVVPQAEAAPRPEEPDEIAYVTGGRR